MLNVFWIVDIWRLYESLYVQIIDMYWCIDMYWWIIAKYEVLGLYVKKKVCKCLVVNRRFSYVSMYIQNGASMIDTGQYKNQIFSSLILFPVGEDQSTSMYPTLKREML